VQLNELTLFFLQIDIWNLTDRISKEHATNFNSTSTDTNSTSSKKYDKFRNFSAIEEYELDYKKRLRSSEFTEGLSKKANSSKTASSANKIQSEKTRVKPTRIQDRTS
jgi:hypothetical protein